MAIVRLAIRGNPRLRALGYQFSLRPSLLTPSIPLLIWRRNIPNGFVLIMGGDNLATLHRWKNYELLLEQHPDLRLSAPWFPDLPEKFYTPKRSSAGSAVDAIQPAISGAYQRRSLCTVLNRF
ncbi:MAG: hypothetical protein R2824_30935 [Saprospiraceae bacterium]